MDRIFKKLVPHIFTLLVVAIAWLSLDLVKFFFGLIAALVIAFSLSVVCAIAATQCKMQQ
jgi:hypothetical protein